VTLLAFMAGRAAGRPGTMPQAVLSWM